MVSLHHLLDILKSNIVPLPPNTSLTAVSHVFRISFLRSKKKNRNADIRVAYGEESLLFTFVSFRPIFPLSFSPIIFSVKKRWVKNGMWLGEKCTCVFCRAEKVLLGVARFYRPLNRWNSILFHLFQHFLFPFRSIASDGKTHFVRVCLRCTWNEFLCLSWEFHHRLLVLWRMVLYLIFYMETFFSCFVEISTFEKILRGQHWVSILWNLKNGKNMKWISYLNMYNSIIHSLNILKKSRNWFIQFNITLSKILTKFQLC